MKSKSFEDVLREHILKKPETETNTLPQNDANVFDVLRSLVTAGAENDAARSAFQGEGEEEDDDTNNAARAAK